MEPGPVSQTFDVAAKAATHSAKAKIRADMLHNLRADFVFPLWATGAEPVPAHLKPENEEDLKKYIDLVKKQSLERVKCLEDSLRNTSALKNETAEFNRAIINSTVTEEQQTRVATSIQFGVDRISHSVSKQAVKLQDTLLNRPPSNKELSAALFCEEFESYSAHRGARDRGRSPANRPRSQSPGRRRSRSRSPRGNNRSQGQNQRGRAPRGRGNGYVQRGHGPRGRGNGNGGNNHNHRRQDSGPTLAGLAAQLDTLSRRLNNRS